nr:hypothetical protein [Tanacetum cinerariifolium]
MTLEEISHSFPPEIIREILLKLPVESLLRCKSVCKEWYSLISEQHFITTHYTLSSGTNNINYEQHRRLVFNTNYGCGQKYLINCPLYDVLFDKSVSNALLLENPLQRPQFQRIRIVGSCNGLLCLLVDEDADYNMFIYNPTTRRSNLLPCSERTGSFWGFYGFGYGELSNDYKVIITETDSKMSTMIYSLKTGKWKEIGHFSCARPLDDGKLVNGVLHWVAGKSKFSDSCKIVSLYLANETYGEVLQPEYHEGDGYFELGVLGECLCVLHDYCETRVVDVWMMKVYGVKDSWTKLASIPYPHIWWGQISAPYYISEDAKLLLRFGPQLVVYDSKDGSSLTIDKECSDACIVVESLVSPFPPLGLADINDDED